MTGRVAQQNSAFVGAIRIPGGKPIGEHNRCELRPGTPKTPTKALLLVVLMMALPLYVVCFGWPGFQSLQVDQTESRWQINLPDGISKASTRLELRFVLQIASCRV